MSTLFAVFFLLSLILLLVGLVKPSVFHRKGAGNQKLTRKNIGITFGLLTLIFFVLVGTTAKPSVKSINEQKAETITSKTISIIPTEVIQTEKKPTPTTTTKPLQNTVAIPTLKPESGKTYLVTRVIDGDTIEIEGGQRVRYIGIDTPETVDPRKAVQCFGQEASSKNKELIAGKQVKLEKDVSETDRYGRLLRYVWVGDIFVNDFLVRQGYAHASSYPPDVKYQQQFTQAQQEAINNNKGLWSSCGSTTSSTSTSQTSQSGSCDIKGNISSSDEKIYHVQGCQSYNKTVIDTGAGERWFCNEQEALQAGWRKALNC